VSSWTISNRWRTIPSIWVCVGLAGLVLQLWTLVSRHIETCGISSAGETFAQRLSDAPVEHSGLQGVKRSVDYPVVTEAGELLVDSALHRQGLLSRRRPAVPFAVARSTGLPGVIHEPGFQRVVPILVGCAPFHFSPDWFTLLRLDRSKAQGEGAAAVPELVLAWGGWLALILVLIVWSLTRRSRAETRQMPHRAVSPGSTVDSKEQGTRLSTDLIARRCQSISSRIGRVMERLSRPTVSADRAWEDWIRDAVTELGRATGVNSASLVRQVTAADGSLRPQKVRQWISPDYPDRGPGSDGRAREEALFPRWLAALSRGEIFVGHVRCLPRSERDILAVEGVQTILVLPLLWRQDLWGYLRFDQCDSERDWDLAELETLRSVSRLFGTALQLRQREHELQTILSLLDRTADSSKTGMLLADGAGRIVGFNQAFVDMWDIPESIAASRDHYQTLAHVLTQVKAPELFLRTIEELTATPDAESYDIVELADGRICERISQPEPLVQRPGRPGMSRVWRFTEVTAGSLLESASLSEDSRETPYAPPDEGRRPQDSSESSEGVQDRPRTVSLHLELVREQERKRLAREIHDQLGQALTGLKLDLAWFSGHIAKDYQSLRSKAESMSDVVSSTVQTVRRIATELRPPILDDLGLAAAVEWQAREFETRAGVSCTVNVSRGLERIEFDQTRSTALFRIFQEILTNITRHANATAVKVTLSRLRDRIELKVWDNGRGISEHEIADPRSIGLIGMRERAAMLGGEVLIRGIQGQGTMVTARIPMENHHD
jgi:signal transduction histidine kinase